MSTQDQNQVVQEEPLNPEQAAQGILHIEKVTTVAAEDSATDTAAPEAATDTAPAADAAPAPVAAPVAGTVVQQPVVAPAPVAAEPQPTPVAPAATAVPEVVAILEKAKSEASTVGKMVLDQIEQYIDVMAPKKPQDPKSGVRWQVMLYRALTTAVNKLDDDFFLVWGTILKVFHSLKDDVFHEAYVFRFMEHVALPAEDQKGFQRLLNLIKTTAEPQGRNAALKQVDFAKTLEFGVTEQGRQKLLNFYNK